VIFGSHTAPTFRNKAAQLKELATDYRGRVEIIVVYTAEAYPIGQYEVERNRDDKVRIEQHRSDAERLAAARDSRQSLGLDNLTFTVDDFSNATATTYGLTPNGAVVIDRTGKVVQLQKWFDAFGLKATLDGLASNR
jgi:hypothetical protein